MNSANQNIKKKNLLNIILFVICACIIAAALVFIIHLRFTSDSTSGIDNNVINVDDSTANDIVAEVPEDNSTDNSSTEDNTTDVDIVVLDKQEMLPEMEELYNQNPDIIGWIKIEGTMIDYPVVFTPEDEEKYLYKDFDGSYNINGVPFLDKDCDMIPETTNLIIYGHNMMSGKMFHGLLDYESEEFWKEHPTIEFKTLYETRTYEVIGAFRDKVYFAYEDCFKFYQFIDPTEEEFNEAIAYFVEKTPYDMNVTAEYGDNLITLVTCAAHQQFGRYVVVAREVTD